MTSDETTTSAEIRQRVLQAISQVKPGEYVTRPPDDARLLLRALHEEGVDAVSKTIYVTGCGDCPFQDTEFDSCMADEAVEIRTLAAEFEGSIPIECPLHGGGVDVRIAAWSGRVKKNVASSAEGSMADEAFQDMLDVEDAGEGWEP